jgi:hypothetical protein
LVPVRNGSLPEAPDGGHNNHVGTLLDPAPAALPDDPPELVEEVALEPLDDIAVAPLAPDAGPDPVAADDDDCTVVEVAFAPVVATAEAVALLPSVTMPLFVTL